MTLINLISASIGLSIGFIILYLVRRDHLHTRYAIWWIPIALVIALIGVFPKMVDHLAWLLGIGYPPVFPLVIGICLLLVKILLMDVERSRNERKLQRLAQRVAMLEAEWRHGNPSGAREDD